MSASSRHRLLVLVLAAATGFACSSRDSAPEAVARPDDAGRPNADAGTALPYASWPNPLDTLPHGRAHTGEVCARGGDDPLRDALCADPPAEIGGLVELYRALGLHPELIPDGRTGLALTAHSTGLGIRSVSAINPRVFTVRLENMGIELLAIAFVRGEQLVELVVRDRGDRELRFYLLSFRQDCNEREDGCRPGDLLTPAIESDWRELTLYDESDVRNTTLDCAPCHQPEGPGTPKILRMQERTTPWTHWLFRSTTGGKALLADYLAAKGDETLAGYTAAQIQTAHPGNLAMLADFYGSLEPNPFSSAAIEREVEESAASQGGAQPADNSIPGESATWQAAYGLSELGEAIAVPYHDVKVTDPSKLARMTQAYQAYRDGELDADALPELRDIYPDDPQQLAHMGIGTEPSADGVAVLLQACGECHNGRLDQRLSRANFRADLFGVTRAERDVAIDRLQRPGDDPLAMPPARVRSLTAEARARAIELLSR